MRPGLTLLLSSTLFGGLKAGEALGERDRRLFEGELPLRARSAGRVLTLLAQGG